MSDDHSRMDSDVEGTGAPVWRLHNLPVGSAGTRAREAGDLARRVMLMAVVAVGLAVCLAVAPSVAGAAIAGCPEANPSYTDACGPTFTVPAWGDAGGWTDPSKYSTIQLADLTGNGRDELIARNDQGLEIYWFDTSVGQWRPQVDAHGVPQVLTAFRSPRPGETLATDWTKPEYYSTIEAANIDGQPGKEILARFADGMHVYKYFPPAGTNNIDGGAWKLIGKGGPFSDAAGYNDPSLYSTIQVAQFRSGQAPMLFARQHSQTDAQTVALYTWNVNGTWTRVPDPGQYAGKVANFSDALCGTPSCYLTVQTGNVVAGDPTGVGDTTAIFGHTSSGVSAFDMDSAFAGWNFPDDGAAPPNWNPGYGPFTDVSGQPDCPFTSESADCLGSSPSYYETLRAADVDGNPGDELLARASDGLRVKHWVAPYYPPSGSCCFVDSHFAPYATLTALGGAASSVQPGLWGSIRTGDVLGNGRDQVLALDGHGLQVYSYDPGSNSWSQLQPSTPLTLTNEWMTHPEYYSTIRVGDIDGSGRDAVVVRGPYGIRTFFYNRRGTGGWESYLPGGYPDFPSRQCPAGVTGPCGQQGAFTALTELAKTHGVIPQTASSVRDVWTGENAPQPTDLTSLQQGLISIANCTGAVPGNPPSYQACTPPADSAGFTAAEWTAVVNEMLAESYNALQVVNLFAQLDSMRQSLFIAQNAALPAIGGDLGLQAAADSTATFSPQSFFAGATGIAASLAGISQPEISAALWVASELISMLPSASPTAMSTFQTTYAGLQGKFAQIVGETEKALQVQSQTVRQDGGLLSLVGQLRASGTWALDTIGMASAANQAFAIWVYQTLMPTVYDRYAITDCFTGFRNSGNTCTGVPAGPGVIGGGQNFTTIGQRLDLQAGVPCVQGSVYSECSYTTPPADLMTQIWGPVSDACTYQPGNAGTAWTFGSCSAGVDPRSSIGANTWDFNSYSGDFDVNRPVRLAAQAVAARDPLPPIVLGRGRIGRRAGKRASALVSATTVLPRRLRLAGASVRLNRLLFESAGRGELARPRAGQAARPLKLRRRGGGLFVAEAPSHPGVRLALRRAARQSLVTVTLRISASLLRVPQACVALPAAIAPRELPHVELKTELVINDGHIRRPVRLTHRWRCARDARGNIDRLVSERPHRYPARGGLALALHGPRRAQPGTLARYVAVVSNRRTDRRRQRTSLWDVVLDARRGRTLRVHELRRGRDRRLSFVSRVTPRQRGRDCIDVVATAPGARAVRAQTCTSITNPSPPPVGLG